MINRAEYTSGVGIKCIAVNGPHGAYVINTEDNEISVLLNGSEDPSRVTTEEYALKVITTGKW